MIFFTGVSELYILLCFRVKANVCKINGLCPGRKFPAPFPFFSYSVQIISETKYVSNPVISSPSQTLVVAVLQLAQSLLDWGFDGTVNLWIKTQINKWCTCRRVCVRRGLSAGRVVGRGLCLIADRRCLRLQGRCHVDVTHAVSSLHRGVRWWGHVSRRRHAAVITWRQE